MCVPSVIHFSLDSSVSLTRRVELSASANALTCKKRNRPVSKYEGIKGTERVTRLLYPLFWAHSDYNKGMIVVQISVINMSHPEFFDHPFNDAEFPPAAGTHGKHNFFPNLPPADLERSCVSRACP